MFARIGVWQRFAISHRELEPAKMSSSNDVLMEPRRMRLNSLATWRGLVIFLMMLDHVRDFFNGGALTSTPTEAGHTTVLLYLTRWITHLCAPTFLFLAGVGIRLRRLGHREACRSSWRRGAHG